MFITFEGIDGSGKSTLAHAIMGHPAYKVMGDIIFDGKSVTELSADKRARLGIFLSFQQPIALPGVTVFTFLYEAYHAINENKHAAKDFTALLKKKMSILNTDFSFSQRALNDGFSGGEKKRFELLQLLILQPKLAILDEIDSGLDVDALHMVASGIQYARKENPSMSIVLITHYQRILQYIIPDVVYVLKDGHICSSGDATLALKIDEHGYAV